MRSHKDVDWNLLAVDTWQVRDAYSIATLAVLMDLRDELKAINRTLQCSNTLAIPQLLRDIRSNTTKSKRKKVKR